MASQQMALLKKRTTLTLPSDALLQAQQLADARHVNLSTVVAEVMTAGLQLEAAKQRSAQVLENYRKAFEGFTDDELAILDGVILEPVGPERG
jgi:hypothetical protein